MSQEGLNTHKQTCPSLVCYIYSPFKRRALRPATCREDHLSSYAMIVFTSSHFPIIFPVHGLPGSCETTVTLDLLQEAGTMTNSGKSNKFADAHNVVHESASRCIFKRLAAFR